jgi:DNA-binding IclR family transcriptional regulator
LKWKRGDDYHVTSDLYVVAAFRIGKGLKYVATHSGKFLGQFDEPAAAKDDCERHAEQANQGTGKSGRKIASKG